jgi:uncharacterized protein YerC
MPQISKYPLTKEVKQELFTLFWDSISTLHTAKDVAEFFSDLLTHTEEMMLAKRFAIALLLFQGKKPIDISRSMHVSFSTIRAVSSWIDRATPQTVGLLKRNEKQASWQTALDKLEEIEDMIPPVRGSNWSQAGKEKWERKMKRNARKTFRK